jgi:hypothetical protein
VKKAKMGASSEAVKPIVPVKAEAKKGKSGK